jgi:hypothetical protein
MNFWHWLRGELSTRYAALRLYRRGMKFAKAHNHPAAVADYSAVIKLEGAPVKLRAMALYNRALVHDAIEKRPEAVRDLKSILDMDGVPEEVRTEAQRKLVRMDRNQTREISIPGKSDSNSAR